MQKAYEAFQELSMAVNSRRSICSEEKPYTKTSKRPDCHLVIVVLDLLVGPLDVLLSQLWILVLGSSLCYPSPRLD